MYSQGCGFSSSRVQLCKLDDKEEKVLKNWCFPTVLLEKTLENLLDSKEIKLVNPKGNNPKYSLKGLMLKLKLQYFDCLMQRADSLEKTLMLGKIEEEGNREWDGWMASLMQWTWTLANSGRWWGTGKSGMLVVHGLWRIGHGLMTEQQQTIDTHAFM